ncbi:MAG: DUF1697 domain-containing protein [Weeksellaceae bacterium]|nr:DUF1697 domain-containing protein [Weeksellaceae bacterium]
MKYCAFLRGVNVNGTSMKMAEVGQVFAEAGMEQVSSVLASGNILFSSDKSRGELKVILEKAMADYFNYDAFLFLRDDKEIKEMVESNPFEKSTEKHIYLFTGVDDVEKLLLEAFENSDSTEGEEGRIVCRTFYWQIPKGDTLGSSFGKILGKKSMKDKMTSRNLNTFEKVLKKIQ